MGKDAFGLQTLKIINDLHQDGVRNFVALMRHSARHYGTAENDDLMELTDDGKQKSQEFGKALPSNRTFRFFSSPVHRCIETSNLMEKAVLSKGGRTQSNSVMDILHPFFVKDMSKIIQMAYKFVIAGDYPAFFRNWFYGKISSELIDDASQSAQRLLDALLNLLKEPSDVVGNICVTHDWHLVLLKEFYLGQRAEDYGTIDYLEGVIFYEKDGGYHVTNYQDQPMLLRF